ncbi:hypothetical protein BJX64DRAFT_261442 [Aspergillus heterothallicus]
MNFVRYFRPDYSVPHTPTTTAAAATATRTGTSTSGIEAPAILVSDHTDSSTPPEAQPTMSRTKRAGSGSDSGHSTHSNTASIPPQTFPLAHPPPKSKSKSQRQCLRLSSRLLLQIQQLHYASASTTGLQPRPVPIFELYQPSTFGKSVGARKAHSRDMYLVQSEGFVHLRGKRDGAVNGAHGKGHGYGNGVLNGNGATANGGTKPRSGSGSSRRKSKSSAEHESSGEEEGDRKSRFKRRAKDTEKERDGVGEEEEEEEDVVAVIHTSPKTKSKGSTGENAEAELYFPLSGSIWDATSPAPGNYRFKQDLEGNGLAGDANGVGLVFSWENRPPSASSTATESSDEGERFVLSVSSSRSTSSRRPWLAQLTRRGLHVGAMDAWQRELRALMIDNPDDGAGLYTLIVTMGVWVARREGWVV